MNQILFLILLLWIGLAIAVGFHADGHNRSTLFWSTLTLISGIFGVAIYLLFITSRGTETPEEGIKTSKEFAYVFAAVGGAVTTSVLAFAFTAGLRIMTLPPVTAPGRRVSPLASTFPLIIVLAALSGLIGGALLYDHNGTKRFFHVLSSALAVLLGLIAFPFLISLIGEPEGLFYGGHRMALALVALILAAALSAEGWRSVRHRVPVLKSRVERSDQNQSRVDSRSRRAFLSVAGAATISFIGYGAFGKNPHREEKIRDNKFIIPNEYELSDLSYGYFEEDDEYRITATVTTTKDFFHARADVDWYVGTGVSYSGTSSSLDFGFRGSGQADLRIVAEGDSRYGADASEIERFELEIHDRY